MSDDETKVIPLKRKDAAFKIHTERDSLDQNTLYRHSALCQTYLPYRNLGDDVTEYNHQNGNLLLSIDCTKVTNLEGKRVYLGLPYGPKARLSMMHIDTMAILQQSPVIEVEDSMTRFVTHTLGMANSGYNIRQVKEQLARLSASMLSVSMIDQEERRVQQFDSKIISGFDLWFPKDEFQRILWPTVIRQSEEYFQSLMIHAIPHDMRAVAALANNAMALDCLAWLTQRLHRIKPGKPQFVAWTQLHAQFGRNYTRLRDLKRIFRRTLKEVLSLYPDARVEERPLARS